MNSGISNVNIEKLRQNIESIIVNRSGIIDLVITALLAKGHIMLQDVPGTGKTMLAKALAKSINGKFQRIQFTPDLLPSDITGTHIFNQKSFEFEFREGPIFTSILLADEINRGTPRTQSCLLQAMEENAVTIDRKTYSLSEPFFVIATQNPLEREGAFIMPYSELDRFMLKTSIGYPEFNEEIQMIQNRKTNDPLNNIEPVMNIEDVLFLQNNVKTLKFEESLSSYILKLVQATRNHPQVFVGASPRAGLQIFRFSQAEAFMKKRDYCIPDDIQKAFMKCLSHRMILKENILSAGNTAEEILNQILNEIPVPI